MAKDRIIYNGIQVIPEWPAHVEAAQHEAVCEIRAAHDEVQQTRPALHDGARAAELVGRTP